NSYDELNRLIKTEYGTLGWSGGGGAPLEPVINPVVRTDEGSLDLLGNWGRRCRGGAAGGAPDRGDLDWTGYSPPRGLIWAGSRRTAATDTFRFMQVINGRNEIAELQLDLDVGTM